MKSKFENIAEYILYLWQVEDYLRAFPKEASGRQEFEEFAAMMREEGIMEKGHLQLAINAIEELEDLHQMLVRQEETYRLAFKKIQPALVLYKSQTDNPAMSDLEACFTFLYNIMLLNLQHKPISEDTLNLKTEIVGLLKYLSQNYQLNARPEEPSEAE